MKMPALQTSFPLLRHVIILPQTTSLAPSAA
jgi:hypothetical protein